MSFLILVSAGLLAGCGDYTRSTRGARGDFYAGKYSDAAKALEKGAHEEGVDQLLFLFDRATALYHAGDYDESIKDFTTADRLAEIKDYTSVSAEAATLFTNDKILPYKGEDFEKVLISQYLALNYLMLGKQEDALVECRRVNHKLHLMISEGKKKYRLNPMASYLAAMLYEDQREWDHAYIDYQAVYKLEPSFPYLGEDLYRLAWKNNIREDMSRWAAEFRLSAEDQKRIRESSVLPEIVVIVENGQAPEKAPHPNWQAVPKFYPRSNPVAYAEVLVNGIDKGRSQPLFDVEATAIKDLDDKYAGLIAKRIGGVVAKEVVANEVGKRTDPIVGAIMRIGMHAVDQADLRSWLTLPKDFQVFRLRVPPGDSYKITLQPRNSAGDAAPTSTPTFEKIVRFENQKKNQRAFVPVRVL